MSEPDRGNEPLPLPEAVILRSEGYSLRPQCVVTLAQTGMGWQEEGREGAHWVPWPLVGGLSDRLEGKTMATDILALDGSSFGSIIGLFQVDGSVTTVAHVVALFRPEMFVEIEGGCIRREVAEADES